MTIPPAILHCPYLQISALQQGLRRPCYTPPRLLIEREEAGVNDVIEVIQHTTDISDIKR